MDDKQIYIADSSCRYEEQLSRTREWGGMGVLEEEAVKQRPAPSERPAPVTKGHLGEGQQVHSPDGW